jgi:predicted nucleic acid-binding protein
MRSDLAAFLVDTNVLVYAYDAGDQSRASRARACIRRLGDARNGAVSAQVLGEFFVVATRRLRPPLTARTAGAIVTNLGRAWPVYDVTGMTVTEAIRAVRQYQLQYWDALIWATAKLHGVPNVLTEDLPSGSLVEGVRFKNPFETGFDLPSLD